MASRLRALGIAGAILLLVGAAVAGAGWLNAGAAYNAENACAQHPAPPNGCNSQELALDNSTATALLLTGVGLAIVGVGLGCVLAAAISFMSRARPGETGPPVPAPWHPPPPPPW